MTNNTNTAPGGTPVKYHAMAWGLGLLLAPVTGGASLGIAACHSGVKALIDVGYDQGQKDAQTDA